MRCLGRTRALWRSVARGVKIRRRRERVSMWTVPCVPSGPPLRWSGGQLACMVLAALERDVAERDTR